MREIMVRLWLMIQDFPHNVKLFVRYLVLVSLKQEALSLGTRGRPSILKYNHSSCNIWLVLGSLSLLFDASVKNWLALCSQKCLLGKPVKAEFYVIRRQFVKSTDRSNIFTIKWVPLVYTSESKRTLLLQDWAHKQTQVSS